MVQKALKDRCLLSDGTYGQVIVRVGHNQFACNLCAVAFLPSVIVLRSHLNGKKHLSGVEKRIVDVNEFQQNTVKEGVVAIKAPGTEGDKCKETPAKEAAAQSAMLENRARAQLQTLLESNKTEPFVGLQYVVELVDENGEEPGYHCVLCDKRGDPRTIMFHFSSCRHRMKYLEKHFPTAIKELASFRYDRDAKVAVIKTIEEVCLAVEAHHGRAQPLVVDAAMYEQEKMRFLTLILSACHASESSGPSFANLVNKTKIQDMIRTMKIKSDIRRTAETLEESEEPPVVVPSRRPTEARRSTRSRSPRYNARRRSRSRSPPKQRRRDDERRSSRDRRLDDRSARDIRRRSRSPLSIRSGRDNDHSRVRPVARDNAHTWDKYR